MEENYSYERLEVLRKIVKLDLISKLKLTVLQRKIEKLVNTNIEHEKDMEELLKFEYYLRMKRWVNSCEESWYSYIKIENDGCGLFEFANGNLNRIIEEERKYNKKYTKMKSKL